MIQIPICDVQYPIELGELFNNHIFHALPAYENLLYWHKLLLKYVQDDSSVLLIRKKEIDRRDVRGNFISIGEDSTRVLFADNAPAWAIMQYCFEGWRPSLNEWKETILLKKIPCHFFEIRKRLGIENYNAKYWHIAHIEQINDHSNPMNWTTNEIRNKCLKFIHPINIFPFPDNIRIKYGGNYNVLCYIRWRYSQLFSPIRTEFMDRIKLAEQPQYDVDKKLILELDEQPTFIPGGISMTDNLISSLEKLSISNKPRLFILDDGSRMVCWEASILYFKRKPIESLLNNNDRIVIKISPTQISSQHYQRGYFIFTKQQFNNLFGDSVETPSFKEKGVYYWSIPPKKYWEYFVPFNELKSIALNANTPSTQAEEPSKRIFIPSFGVKDWQKLLAKPNEQWKKGYSATSLAYCWHENDDFPPEIIKLFRECNVTALQNINLLIAIPEYKVDLPGGKRASQNDIFVLARGEHDLISITVEGKVHEPFGETIGDWQKDASDGKKLRLKYLCACLGINDSLPEGIRYQLIHRTASAVIEAKRFTAKYAIMIVHTFGNSEENYDDYTSFLGLFGARAGKGQLAALGKVDGIELYAGWVYGDEKYRQYPCDD